jgi:dihydroflavonol-4-reductase
MRAPILVTGATGFIGRYLLPLLLEDGAPVRAMIRHPDLLAPQVRARLEVVQGDIRDRAALRRAVAGADTVLHLAACARAWMHDRNAYRAINVDAVEALLRRRPCRAKPRARVPTRRRSGKASSWWNRTRRRGGRR